MAFKLFPQNLNTMKFQVEVENDPTVFGSEILTTNRSRCPERYTEP